MDDREKLNEAVSLYNTKVKKNLKVVTPEDLGIKYLIRLDKNKLRYFTPYISHSQAKQEDRTVPRVVTSPYILGCLIAIPFNLNIVQPYNANTGLYIHAFAFNAALAPNDRLVFDASATEETWLVTYDNTTRVYKPEVAGSVILNSYTVYPSDKNKNDNYKLLLNLYVNISLEEGLPFNKKIHLDKGYYSLEFFYNYTEKSYSETTLESDKREVKIKKISEGEFTSQKDKRTFVSLEELLKPSSLFTL